MNVTGRGGEKCWDEISEILSIPLNLVQIGSMVKEKRYVDHDVA